MTLLLDALDEAEDQASPATDTMPICQNKALQFITRYLSTLPANVRFIVTTRPNVMGSLHNTFEGLVVLCPADLKSSHVLSAVEPTANDGTSRSSNGGSGTGSPDLQGVHGREDGGLANISGEVMVIHTVRQALLQDEDSMRDIGTDLAALYRVYMRIFDDHLDALSESDRAGVRQALQVVMAAQEPLAQVLLRQMGLKQAVEQLPGWGVLFYVAEHHLYVLHKSLADWLRDASLSQHHAVDILQGQFFLAKHLAGSIMQLSVRTEATGTAGVSPYTLKHAVKHLAASSSMDEAMTLLDEVLSHFTYLDMVVKAGHSHRIIEDLGGCIKHTAFSADLLRFLSNVQHELDSLKDPLVVLVRLIAPVATETFSRAAGFMRKLTRADTVYNRYAHWSGARLTLQVRVPICRKGG